jgi:hypothetical protein
MGMKDLALAFVKSPGVLKKALSKLTNTPDGHRLAPTKTKDAKLGFRIDKGPGSRMVLQANSNAESSSIRQWIQKAPRGSHTVITSVDATGLDERQLTNAFEEKIKDSL